MSKRLMKNKQVSRNKFSKKKFQNMVQYLVKRDFSTKCENVLIYFLLQFLPKGNQFRAKRNTEYNDKYRDCYLRVHQTLITF